MRAATCKKRVEDYERFRLMFIASKPLFDIWISDLFVNVRLSVFVAAQKSQETYVLS